METVGGRMTRKTSMLAPSELTACSGCGAPTRALSLGAHHLNCPTCNCVIEQTQARERQEWQEQERAQRLAAANINPRLAECTFERFQPEEGNRQAFDQCAQYPKRWPLQLKEAQDSGLLLWGKPGRGKSHLAVAVALALLNKEAPVHFDTVLDFLSELRDGMRLNVAEGETIGRLTTVPLLVLDDLGAEKDTAWTNEKLYQVINRRYQNLLPLVATTNYDLNQLEQSLGTRTVSRLLEMCVPLEVNGPDRRKQAAKERKHPS
jgi:DNA replication protein DnaC